MGTIALWAFFIVWGGCLIKSLIHRNFTLTFNFAFEMYIVREFVVGNVEANWKMIVVAILICWVVMILSCIPKVIMEMRREARLKRADKES